MIDNSTNKISELKNNISNIKIEIKEKEEYFRNLIDKIEKEYIEVNLINTKFKTILKYYENKIKQI